MDVLQADATRCLGSTGFLAAAALCEAHAVPLSTHCAPALHAQLACAARPVVHVEWFHDHVRLERMAFDGRDRRRRRPAGAATDAPGFGLDLRGPTRSGYLEWRSA